MEGQFPPQLRSHWSELLKEGQPLTFRKGQSLLYEGHTPYGIFVLQSGRVRFIKGSASCNAAEHLCPAPQGKVIGLHHFFSETPFCCSCNAETDCRLVFISKTQLMSCMEPGTSR